MKLTTSLTVAALLLADTALGFRLPAFIELRQQPKCSLYSGFKDSPSFTSFCRQLPKTTRAVVAPNTRVATSRTKHTLSVSSHKLTLDGGDASSILTVDPGISSAAAPSTFELQNYTIATSRGGGSSPLAATSSKPAPTDFEVNCYINGSKVPMSQCTRTAGLTRHHGYTYTPSTLATTNVVSLSSQPASQSKGASSSAKPTSSSQIVSLSKATPSAAAPSLAGSNSIAPLSSKAVASSGVLPASNCTRTMNLTRHYGYTYSHGTAPADSTAKLTSSVALSSSAELTTGSQSTFTVGNYTLSTSYIGSSDCGNATAAEPHQMSNTPYLSTVSICPSTINSTQPTTSSLLASSSASAPSTQIMSPSASPTASTTSTFSVAYLDSSACNNATAAEPHRMNISPSVSAESATQSSTSIAPSSSSPSSGVAITSSSTSEATTTSSSTTESSADIFSSEGSDPQVTGSFRPVRPAFKFQQTSTTTVVDATVTTIVPCATDISTPDEQQQEQKRDATFMTATAGGICDAGVYCVNSTYISDAPASWHWDSVALKQGQLCLDDNVFNTPWIEQQCACAGL